MMVNGGDGDGDRVQIEIRGQQFFDSREDRNCVFGCGLGGAARIRLDGGYQRNSQPRRFQFTIDPKMVAAKCAGPGDGNTENRFAGYFAAPASGPFPSTAFRQRP